MNIKRPHFYFNVLLSYYNFPTASALHICVPTQYPDFLWVMHVFLLTGYMVLFRRLYGGVSVPITHTVTQLKASVGWNWSYLLGWTVTSVTCRLCRLGQHQREVGCNHGRGSPINAPLGFTLDQYRDFTNLDIGAFVANKTKRMLMYLSTIGRPAGAVFCLSACLIFAFFSFNCWICIQRICILSWIETELNTRDCNDSLSVTQHWRDSTLTETRRGWGSKVTSPFGTAETWAFIDPTLMQDLCYLVSIRGFLPPWPKKRDLKNGSVRKRNGSNSALRMREYWARCIINDKGRKSHKLLPAHYFLLPVLSGGCSRCDETSKRLTFGSRSSQQFSISAMYGSQ